MDSDSPIVIEDQFVLLLPCTNNSSLSSGLCNSGLCNSGLCNSGLCNAVLLGLIPLYTRALCNCHQSCVSACCGSGYEVASEFEVWVVRWDLDELKQEAERQGLMIPVVQHEGTRRGWWWDLTQSSSCAYRGSFTASLPYQRCRDEMFDVIDEVTGTPFTSYQMQMLSMSLLHRCYGHLNNTLLLHSYSQRKVLAQKWGFSSPPLDEIRDYFGEEIAFSVAWSDTWLKFGLFLPAVSGLSCLMYGIIAIYSSNRSVDHLGYMGVAGGTGLVTSEYLLSNTTSTLTDGEGAMLMTSVDSMLRALLDNRLVPYNSMFVCVWTALCTAKWRISATHLQFRWGMTGFKLDREEERICSFMNPLTDLFVNGRSDYGWDQKIWRTVRKLISISITILSFIPIIWAFLLSIYVKFRIRECLKSEDASQRWAGIDGYMIANFASSVTNVSCTLLFSRLYILLARRLTLFEDPVFESDFEISLSWKLFLMEFVSTHFFNLTIIFFRHVFEKGGIFGIDPSLCDMCDDDDCLFFVSVNVVMTTVIQGLLQPIIILVVTTTKYLRNLRIQQAGEEGRQNPELTPFPRMVRGEFLLPRLTLPCLPNQEFATLVLMLRRVKLYSMAVMYVAACPCISMLLLVVEVIGTRIDRTMFTQTYRRPRARSTDGIGCWDDIQSMINVVGIITTSYITAMLTQAGRGFLGVNWDNYFSLSQSDMCDPCSELVRVRDAGCWVLCAGLLSFLMILTQALSSLSNGSSLPLRIARRRQRYEVARKMDIET